MANSRIGPHGALELPSETSLCIHWEVTNLRMALALYETLSPARLSTSDHLSSL